MGLPRTTYPARLCEPGLSVPFGTPFSTLSRLRLERAWQARPVFVRQRDAGRYAQGNVRPRRRARSRSGPQQRRNVTQASPRSTKRAPGVDLTSARLLVHERTDRPAITAPAPHQENDRLCNLAVGSMPALASRSLEPVQVSSATPLLSLDVDRPGRDQQTDALK